jgi:DNA-binding beta-propeller fold protein YncE
MQLFTRRLASLLPGPATAIVLALGICLAASLTAVHADGGYHLLKTYPFTAAPGSTGEYFDYVSVDPTARRVYLGRGTAVQIMNADSGELVGYVSGFKRQHGVALAPELNRGFISDGSLAQVTIFDLKTLKKVGTVKAEDDADAIVYDPSSQRVLTMNGDSKSSTVIDAKNGQLIRTIELDGAPEFAVADGKGTIYANLADKDQIIAIDAATLEIKSRWDTAPAGEPTALAIDPEHHRLFSAGRKPQTLIVLDTDSGKVVQSFPISAGTDAAAFDSGTGDIFISTRDGKLHVFHEDSADKYSVVDTVDTQFGAKTMGLDSKTHQLFLDTADFGSPAQGKGGKAGARAPVAGTFRVLVYGP